MKRAYVYALKVDGLIRYYGKGRNHRIGDHVRFAKRHNEALARGEKTNSLRFHARLAKSIRAEAKIEAIKIYEGLSDAVAYLLELSLILAAPPGSLWNEYIGAHGRTSQSARDMWANPDYVKKQSQAMRARWENPASREGMMRGVRAGRESIDVVALSAAISAKWREPEYRNSQLEKWGNEEFKKRHSDAIKSSISEDRKLEFGLRVRNSWADPIKREARVSAMKRAAEMRRARKLQKMEN